MERFSLSSKKKQGKSLFYAGQIQKMCYNKTSRFSVMTAVILLFFSKNVNFFAKGQKNFI